MTATGGHNGILAELKAVRPPTRLARPMATWTLTLRDLNLGTASPRVRSSFDALDASRCRRLGRRTTTTHHNQRPLAEFLSGTGSGCIEHCRSSIVTVLAYSRSVRIAIPGDFLLRPVPIVAGLLLVLNDHFLKGRFGDAITGKLSDAAGLVFIPLLMLSIVELVRAARHARWHITFRDLAASVVVVGGALVAAKLSPSIAHAFGGVGALARFPFTGRFDAVTITHDPTDLWTLPALAIAWFQGAVVIRRRRCGTPAEQTLVDLIAA
jgi:hypothetical protein